MLCPMPVMGLPVESTHSARAHTHTATQRKKFVTPLARMRVLPLRLSGVTGWEKAFGRKSKRAMRSAFAQSQLIKFRSGGKAWLRHIDSKILKKTFFYRNQLSNISDIVRSDSQNFLDPSETASRPFFFGAEL